MAINRILKKQVTNLQPGTIIRGKFKGETYQIKRKLGEGAIGVVYLCQSNQKTFALKISEKQTSMTMEVNVLKALKQVQGSRLGPALFDVDDWITPHGIYSFYVMEYIKGESIEVFIRKNNAIWIGPLLLQLIEKLEALHQAGWVFGDLKTDNLIVGTSPPRVRWVDVGGITQIGRSIKEYTEFFDRGHWALGTRRAEPSYDLFSLVMVFLQIYYPKRFSRPEQGRSKYLFKKIDQIKDLKPYTLILKKAIIGKYDSASQMKQELKQVLYKIQKQTNTRTKRETINNPTLMEAAWMTLIGFFYILCSFFVG